MRETPCFGLSYAEKSPPEPSDEFIDIIDILDMLNAVSVSQ